MNERIEILEAQIKGLISVVDFLAEEFCRSTPSQMRGDIAERMKTLTSVKLNAPSEEVTK